MIDAPSPLAFFDKVRWLDGRPLLDTIEPYRRNIFDNVLYTFDEGQAHDDLDLAKKLVTANPIIAREIELRAKEILRKDGRGRMQILPARNIAAAHGKTYLFVGFDEIHAYRSHDLFEALAPDPKDRLG